MFKVRAVFLFTFAFLVCNVKSDSASGCCSSWYGLEDQSCTELPYRVYLPKLHTIWDWWCGFVWGHVSNWLHFTYDEWIWLFWDRSDLQIRRWRFRDRVSSKYFGQYGGQSTRLDFLLSNYTDWSPRSSFCEFGRLHACLTRSIHLLGV